VVVVVVTMNQPVPTRGAALSSRSVTAVFNPILSRVPKLSRFLWVSFRAVASPIPEDAPVTSAVWLVS